ncbi:MAG: glycosyltransferase family 8 protein [Lachnospiraceae bacterium]|jgi:lipopolysaccharide biosynthesis glycosyltransferase|nr:glycosyltransferase family 8 protein [Lachnospiraceae bacterium]
MVVVYASNDGYARHLGVSLYSLYARNRKVEDVRVFVLSMGIGADSADKLREVAEGFGRELRFVEVGDPGARVLRSTDASSAVGGASPPMSCRRLRMLGSTDAAGTGSDARQTVSDAADEADETVAPSETAAPGSVDADVPDPGKAGLQAAKTDAGTEGIDTGGFDPSILGRFFIGSLLPDDVERVLYLDCDTVVCRGLEALWGMDLKGLILGAVEEPTIYPAVRSSLGLGRTAPYFNSGVLLIDLKRWREEDIERKLLSFFRDAAGGLFAGDQDAINGVLKGRIRPLLPTYNFFSNYYYFPYSELVRLSPGYGSVGKKRFLQAKRRPAILHFCGDERPWVAGNKNPYRRLYTRNLKKTPWRGTPPETGKEAYMAAYHGMNLVTRICPPARRVVSRLFGMRVVKGRKKGSGNN